MIKGHLSVSILVGVLCFSQDVNALEASHMVERAVHTEASMLSLPTMSRMMMLSKKLLAEEHTHENNDAGIGFNNSGDSMHHNNVDYTKGSASTARSERFGGAFIV